MIKNLAHHLLKEGRFMMLFDINYFSFGLTYRQNSGIIFSTGVKIEQFNIWYSYEGLSDGGMYNHSFSSHEVSMSYIFNRNKETPLLNK
ncbi:MAG: type IX secretion system membrane protein PorP/SprF [Bacteroidales bacterium]